MNSIYVDWGNCGSEWEFVGASLMREDAERRKESGEEDVYPEEVESSNMPMMNYVYPLERCSELPPEKILEVCKETNCTVVYNNNDDKYYLALTGCGMDLSQDIAYVYMIADGCIHWDMLNDVCIQPALSISMEKYKVLMTELKRQLKIKADNCQARIKEINEVMKTIKEKKVKKVKSGGVKC